MTTQQATFAAGCFWGVEEEFRNTPGVLTTQVGYTGGIAKNPTYQQVCSGTTGHAEAVHLTFDDKIISYEKLLELFWEMHDPTTIDRQGPDVGSQYRSAIFTHTKEQERKVKESLARKQNKISKKIVTQIISSPTPEFYRAEEYHQGYLHKKERNIF